MRTVTAFTAILCVVTPPVPARAQTGGPCTEAAIKQQRLAAADDAFSYMPPYGKPVIGKPAIQSATKEKFAGRTNVTRSWRDDHRIVVSTGGDMAYEAGTLHVAYDEGGKRTKFDAVMLTVFKAKNGTCEVAALTMQPLEE
jgi:ketosteroid isomerase-like protein